MLTRRRWRDARLGLAAQLCAAMSAAVGLAAAIPDERIPIESLLDTYDGGDYAVVARQLQAVEDERILDRLDDDLHNHGKRWIEAADPAMQRRRAFIAGAMAAELTHVLAERHTADDDRANNHAVLPTALPTLGRYIWDRMGASPDEVDRLWTLTCLATWQDWGRTTIGAYDSVLQWMGRASR